MQTRSRLGLQAFSAVLMTSSVNWGLSFLHQSAMCLKAACQVGGVYMSCCMTHSHCTEQPTFPTPGVVPSKHQF
jgi:hypothetical protein